MKTVLAREHNPGQNPSKPVIRSIFQRSKGEGVGKNARMKIGSAASFQRAHRRKETHKGSKVRVSNVNGRKLGDGLEIGVGDERVASWRRGQMKKTIIKLRSRRVVKRIMELTIS